MSGFRTRACGGRSASHSFCNSECLPTFKQFDLRASKGFRLGGLDLNAYADARNVLNFRNVLAVFVTSGDIVSPLEHQTVFAGDS